MLPERNTSIGNLLDSTKGLNVAGAARAMIERMPTFEIAQVFDAKAFDFHAIEFLEHPATEQIWGRVENKLSPEAGLYLAIEAAKGNIQLEMGKRYVIVMDPVLEPYPLPKSDGIPAVFEVIHDRGGVWLTTRYVDTDSRWSKDDIFVFSTSK